ncbi:MAG TPA: AAA family ATPase [Candidatus Aminicenantes bacterium]|nr:AAA family ATPase [Candidatus Aminicenantes bacterium]HRY66242.1 AAA family ATPase [Candidatus Aminicenantes bacterium]HRZ73156.1 AAA family ATPase [Candidatus Aminicenantes bacterium]
MSKQAGLGSDLDLLKRVDLPGFVSRHYGLRISNSGAALCPFHEDNHPSLSFFNKNGIWGWKCHACDIGGSIMDFVMKKEGLALPDAIKFVTGLEGLAQKPAGREAGRLEIIRSHSYTDEDGKEIWQKVKLSDGTFRCRRMEGTSWAYNLNGIAPLPYRYDKLKEARAIIITEGERDADTLAGLGFDSTCGPFGKDSWPDEITPLFSGKEIRIIFDVGQDEAASKLAEKLSLVSSNISILNVPLPNHEDDITDYLCSFDSEEQKRDAFYGIVTKEERYQSKSSLRPNMLTVQLSGVEPREVPWLWKDYIPLGRATLISGDPGSAKTWFCLDMACRVSRGFAWPDGSPGIKPAKTILLTVEDDIHDTIRPRVESLGGDASMIAAYNPEQPLHLDLNSNTGLKRLEDEVIRLGNVRLVIIDPIIDFSGDVNPNATEDVRNLLTPLIRLASKHSFALVLVGHLNKAQALNAIYRAGGSTSGWLGKCRSALMIIRDTEEKPLRHVIPIKTNIATRELPQLEFRIIRGKLDIEVSSDEIDPQDQLNPQQGRNPREREEAVDWIKSYFDGRNEIPTGEVEEAAKQNGISISTLKRAKRLAGFKSILRQEDAGTHRWLWVRSPILQ